VTALVLDHVNVDFPIYGTQRSLRKALLEGATGGLIGRDKTRSNRITVRALVDISLDLNDGDRIGLVGHNGAGKSTLLKVMAGVYEPSSGKIMTRGRITPLFDSMPGMDPEDTGYENTITAGMLFGMTRAEIEKKVPEIEEFSELGEYFALPMRSYSLGMATRLGFAVATAIDPGILLMDEGIGAGDARFAERAARRMERFIDKSRILVLASHSEALIRSTCNKAAFMKAGRVLAVGGIDEIFKQYHDSIK
jgi:ABC-type polysaccharide/polyol phosphate transport system ATPase subunit